MSAVSLKFDSEAVQKLSLTAGARFVEGLKIHGLPEQVIERLAAPASSSRFSLPVRMDDGAQKIFTGWRIRYADAFGPTKGGVRFYPETNGTDLAGLALRLLLKCAVNGLPHGGAGGGVAVDPRMLSSREREGLARAYVRALDGQIGPERDILSPDLGTDAETMGWMADEYNRLHRTTIAGAINGKPVALGGIPGRPGATARGAWSVLREVLEWKNISPQGLTCAVQGYGSAGGNLAVLLEQQGLKIVAASDASAGWHHPKGLNAAKLWRHKQAGQRFADLVVEGARRLAPHEVLTVAADIVIPAVASNHISRVVAESLQCRMILEMANAPIASDAESIVEARGILVIPDVVANAGGITMSHFEWAQNRSGLSWTADEAHDRLDARMLGTARAAIRRSDERNVSLAVAAQLLALEKVQAVLSH